MRYLYQNYAARGIGVPEDGLQKALEAITNGTFEPFFNDHVYGTKPIDYNRFLYHAGYRLERGFDDSKSPVNMGVRLERGSDELKLSGVEPGGAAFEAGLTVGDVIISVDGRKATRENFASLAEDLAVGDTVSVTAFRGNQLKSFELVMQDGGNVKYELIRMDNTTTLQNQIRRGWLGLAAG
jgi:predicted metalloprotease with PDZ domain